MIPLNYYLVCGLPIGVLQSNWLYPLITFGKCWMGWARMAQRWYQMFSARLQYQWRYCSLALSHRCQNLTSEEMAAISTLLVLQYFARACCNSVSFFIHGSMTGQYEKSNRTPVTIVFSNRHCDDHSFVWCIIDGRLLLVYFMNHYLLSIKPLPKPKENQEYRFKIMPFDQLDVVVCG